MKEILIPLNFTTTPVLYDSKQSFSASDEESGVLTFTTTADVTGTVASLTIRNASENANRQTVLIERLDVNSSPFSYAVKMPLPFGNYEGELLLKKNLTVLVSASFLFGVNSSLSAEVLPKLVEAYSLDNLVEEVETEVSNLKDAYSVTVSETVKGVKKTESTLQLSENVRYLNEATRKTNELLRISQEAARVVAEEGRVTEFGNLVDSAVIEQTVTQEVAEKYQEFEATQANRLLSVESELAETVRGEAGKTVQTLAGVIRNSGTGWFFIDDAGHNRINMSTVVVQTGSIRVEHTASAIKVGSLIAAADETFAKEGMICGASVGNTFSLIDLYFPLNVQVKGDGTFVAKNYFTPSLSLVFSGDNSQFTLTHPSCDALDTPSLVCPISAGSSGEFAVSYSGTSVTVERRGDLAGYIYYDVATTSFKYAGDNVNNLTFDFTNGILTVAHSAVVGNLYGILVSERDGGYKPKVVSPLTSSFQLKFFDGAGTLITTPDANCKAYFARVGAKYKMPFKTGERVLINRGNCKADAKNVVNASANVWIYGAMQL